MYPRLSFLPALAALWLSCSVNIHDPEEEIRRKIAQKAPWEMASLEGTWQGDSAFTTSDSKPTYLGDTRTTILRIYPDSTWSAHDPLKYLASSNHRGRMHMGSNSLWLYAGTAGNAPVKKLTGTLRFLGNYLELFDPSANRFVFFHKVVKVDTAKIPSLLDSSMWEWKGSRADDYSLPTTTPAGLFEYLSFSPDSFSWERTNKGFARTDSGDWNLAGRTLTLNGDSQSVYLADFAHADTLLLWTLRDGKPDSRFNLFVNTAQKAKHYLKVNGILGYWRTDTLTIQGKTRVTNPGNFYDLEFDTAFTVRTYANIDSLPGYVTWQADSGWFRLRQADPGSPSGKSAPERFRLENPSANTLILSTSGTGFTPNWRLRLTRIDKSPVMQNPLARFPEADYAHIAVGSSSDTLRYYYRGNFVAGSPERFELAAGTTGADWLVFTFNPQAENFLNDQSGFVLRFAAAQAPLTGVYRSLPGLDVVIRSIAGTTGKKLVGEMIGRVGRFADAAATVAEDTVEIKGTFQLNRSNQGALKSPLWTSP